MNEPAWIQVIFGGVSSLSALIGVYVGLTMKAIAAELRRDMAIMENNLVSKINGTYRRSELCIEKHQEVDRRLVALESESHLQRGEE